MNSVVPNPQVGGTLLWQPKLTDPVTFMEPKATFPKMLCAQVGAGVQKDSPLCSCPILSFHPALRSCLSEFPELLGALAPSPAACCWLLGPCWAGRRMCPASLSPSPASASDGPVCLGLEGGAFWVSLSLLPMKVKLLCIFSESYTRALPTHPRDRRS